MIALKIINYFYYNNFDQENEELNSPVLCLKCRDENKKHYLIQILDKGELMPRFGILEEELWKIKNEPRIVKYEKAPKSLYGENVINVYVEFPFIVNKIRDKFTKTFQADVKWEKMAMSKIIKKNGLKSPYILIPNDYEYRFLKIKDILPLPDDKKFYIRGRTCYWDIEVDTSKIIEYNLKPEDMEDMPIISITTYDDYDDVYDQFVWHEGFINEETREYENYVIPNALNGGKEINIRKIRRREYRTEIDMLKGFISYFSKNKFDYMFGFFSYGGWSKNAGAKTWINGFDSLCFYLRSRKLGLNEYMQRLSPCVWIPNGGYSVYLRENKGEKKKEVYIKGVCQIDFVFSEKTLRLSYEYYDFRGHKLSDWASYFLDYGKLDKEKLKVWEYWKQKDVSDEDEFEIVNNVKRVKNKGIEFLLDYNLIDVKICYDLDMKFDVIGKQVGRSEVSISPPEDGLVASKLHDHFKLTFYQDSYSFDSKYQKKNKREKNGKTQIGDKFTITLDDIREKLILRGSKKKITDLTSIGKIGGFVPQPSCRKIYEGVAVIDFSKFYPNVIKSTNAGIETAIDLDHYDDEFVYDINGNKYDRKSLIETPIAFFRKDVKSINSDLFDLWINNRVKAQEKLKEYFEKHKTTETNEYKMLYSEQYNLKNFLNAAFGVLGLQIDRTYSELCFNSCTLTCRDLLMFCIKIITEEKNVDVIYGDTDSLFIDLKSKDLDDQIKEANEYVEFLNENLDKYLDEVYNIQDHSIFIDLETISDKLYMDTMKHYIKRNVYVNGVKLDKPEMEIKGMDLKKRATSKIASELQENIVKIIFESENELEDIKKYIKEFDKNLEQRKWIDVCKRGAINKKLSEYYTNNQSAVAARNTFKYLGKYYEPGSNPFLGVFSRYPQMMNNKVIRCNGDFVMSFDEEDEEYLKKMGFDLNWKRIRKTECFTKTKHLLSLFNTNYYDIIEGTNIKGLLAI